MLQRLVKCCRHACQLHRHAKGRGGRLDGWIDAPRHEQNKQISLSLYLSLSLYIYIYIYIYILSASWKLPGRFLWFPSSTSPNVFVWFSSLCFFLWFPSSQETFLSGFRRWLFMVSVAAGNVFLWFPSRNVCFYGFRRGK